MPDISDTKETIEKASELSGAKVMLEDLAKKMRNGKATPPKIDDYYVKTAAEIPDAVNKIVDALMKYAEKVKQKRMFYSAHFQTWSPFGEEDKDKEIGELERIVITIQRITTRPPGDVAAFNEYVKFGLKNMIMGGVSEG